MKKYLHLLLIPLIAFLASCGGDDPAPPPNIVGTWELASYATINLPPGYESNEGVTYELNELTIGGGVISSYELMIAQDGTFTREVGRSGTLPSEDAGTWTQSSDGEDLVLNSDDSTTDEDFSIEKNEGDDLWLAFTINFSLIPDATIAALFEEHGTSAAVNEHINSLSDEEFNALFDTVSLDLIFVFERKS